MAAIKLDPTLRDAVELAREAAESVAEPGAVGEHLGVTMDEERLATHSFACAAKAYVGWRWSVTVARVPRSKTVTVCETNLLPGAGALLAPRWTPYADRLAPGDIGPGDVTPKVDDDPLLEAGFEATGDDEVDEIAQFELGLDRPRVLSAEGREAASTRWYAGANGPSAEVARRAPEQCRSCGFFIPMRGALRSFFGVCANAWSPSDGRVVSNDHGCGAHSEVDLTAPEPEIIVPAALDDYELELV